MTEGAARPDPEARDFRDVAAALVLTAMPVVLYAPAAGQWWTGDDTQILKHALSHSLRGVLTVPSEWRELSWLYFTPLIDASVRLDAALFGLQPAAWYVRHLLVIGLTAALFYALMRGSVGRVASAAAALLLLAASPVAEVSRQLWVRHYVEGLACAFLSLLLFRRAVVGRGGWLAAFGAGVAGLVAMLGKEVFAAVPLVALALPWGAMRRRSRAAVPLLVALAGYLVWRNAMVGYWGGNRSGGIGLLEPVRRALAYLELFPNTLVGVPAAAGLALLALALFLLRPSRAQAAAIVLVAGLVLAPLSLLSDPPAGRYAIVPLAAVAALIGTAAGEGLNAGGARRLLAVLLLAGALVPASVKGHIAFAAAAPAAARSRAEAIFYARQSRPGDVLYRPVEPAWYFDGLDWLGARSGKGGPRAVVYDPITLCDGRVDSAHVYAYDPKTGSVASGLPEPLAEIAATCARLDRTMPLSVDLTYRDSTFAWRLGPDQGGTWAFLSGEGGAPFSASREGSLFIRFLGDVNLRVRHETPDGRLGLSPPLTLHVRDGTARTALTEAGQIVGQ
ncbi:MAG: hypothetical protein ACHQJD_01190 [Thermoanaerobaculia bacterium]